jgi:hypothetical protein
MTTEELLKPRYKVSHEGYPDMYFNKGEIITLEFRDGVNTEYFYQHPKSNSLKGRLYKEYFDLYPSIFKPLEWYEERDISEMPEYAKDLENDLIGKVYRILERGLCIGFKDNLVHYGNCLPATEAEFLNYQSTIK